MEPAYDQFSPADFLTDEAFVSHQLSPTSQSRVFWDKWVNEHPQRQQQWQQAIHLLEAIRLGLDEYAQTYLPAETIRQLLIRIQQTNSQGRLVEKPVRRLAWQVWAVAATVFLGLGIGLWWQANQQATLYEQRLAGLTKPFIQKINTTHHPQLIRLPDNSRVSLAPNSRLSYPVDFGRQNRLVYLSGEAAFSVTRSPTKSFLVLANEVVTKVLGTQFIVRALARESQVRVQVQTGQVAVYQDQSDQKVVLLLSNQQAIFARKTEQFDKTLVAVPRLLATASSRKSSPTFLYNETPVTRVFEELQAAYGIDIRFNREALAHCQLTSSLGEETFHKKLDIICRTIGATHEIIDGQVVINGGSCQ